MQGRLAWTLTLCLLACVGQATPERIEAPSRPSVPAVVEPMPSCRASVERLRGEWSASTEVWRASEIDDIGLRGHYRLFVAGVGCRLHVRVQKVGIAGREIDSPREGEAILRFEPGSSLARAQVQLRSTEERPPLELELALAAHDDRLHGTFAYVGRSAPRGYAGVLSGVRAELASPLEVDVAPASERPCEVRCRLGCDGHRQRPDLGESALATCVAGCPGEFGVSEAECPTAGPLPLDPFAGPFADEDAACRHALAESFDGWCEADDCGCTLEPLAVEGGPLPWGRVALLSSFGSILSSPIEDHRLAIIDGEGIHVAPHVESEMSVTGVLHSELPELHARRVDWGHDQPMPELLVQLTKVEHVDVTNHWSRITTSYACGRTLGGSLACAEVAIDEHWEFQVAEPGFESSDERRFVGFDGEHRIVVDGAVFDLAI